MKLSCLPVSLYADLSAGQRSLADWFRFAADLGLDGADLSVVHLESHQPEYLRSLRSQAMDLGIQIAMVVTYADFTHPDPAVRARQVDDLGEADNYANELLAKLYAGGDLGSAPAWDGNDEWPVMPELLSDPTDIDSAKVEDLIAERAVARREKNFAKADEIRATLQSMKVILEDGPEGTSWRLAT